MAQSAYTVIRNTCGSEGSSTSSTHRVPGDLIIEVLAEMRGKPGTGGDTAVCSQPKFRVPGKEAVAKGEIPKKVLVGMDGRLIRAD